MEKDFAMPRLTSRVFTDLAIWMAAFGIAIGLVFPPFMTVLGLPAEAVFTPLFYTASILAGMFAAVANYLLARTVLRPRLKMLAERMGTVEGALKKSVYENHFSAREHNKCFIEVDSEDELGEAASAFNGLVTTLKRSREVEHAAQAFAQALSSDLDLESLGERALALVRRYAGMQAGAIYVEQEGRLALLANQAIANGESLAQSNFLRETMRTDREATIHLPLDVEVDALLTRFRPQEIMIVPLDYNKQPLGVLLLASAEPFSEDSRRLIELFRQGLSLAVNNAVIHSQIQKIALLDPLTGAYNRRFGMKRLKEEFNRAQRDRAPLGVVMFDIDHFKSVNDTYGHMVGDRVLVEIHRRAEEVLREGDVLVRYGGEEFMLLLPGASRNDSSHIADRLLRAVREARFEDDDQLIRVTVSAGVCAYPEFPAESAEVLLNRADEALYKAKRGGRDRLATLDSTESEHERQARLEDADAGG